eukprot:scaffold167741_cov34-Tisochrysis_lutea.AAC.6
MRVDVPGQGDRSTWCSETKDIMSMTPVLLDTPVKVEGPPTQDCDPMPGYRLLLTPLRLAMHI